MEEKIEAIEKFISAIRKFSDMTNNKAYRDKNTVEQDNEELVNALFVNLDKLERFYKGQYSPSEQTKEELLASKMSRITSALRQGKIPIMNEVVDEFISALDLLDLASAAKNAGKTELAKDKLKGLGG